MTSGRRLLAAGAVVTTLAVGNVVRATCWTQADGFVCGPLADRPLADRLAPIDVAGLSRVDVPAPFWRPIAIELRVTGSTAVRVSERPDEPGVTLEPGRTASLVARRPSTPEDRIALWAEPVASASGAPATVRVSALSPVLASGRMLTTLGVGAAMGVALAWALLFRPEVSAASATAGDTAVPGGAASWIAPLAVLAVVHGAWIVLKPPLQSPDEPQHHARATSASRTPFVAGARTVSLAAAHRNPLTWTPNRLHAIIQTSERLSDEDVRTLKGTRWPPPGSYPATEAIAHPIASYPPVYYWLLFAGGEMTTAALRLPPYGSLLAYRAVSVLLAGGLWLAVYALMRRTPDLRAWALPAFVVLVANPATASITASVNPDAVVIPATTLLLLATWRRLAAGGSDLAVAASAALALAVKPSGMLAAVTVGAAVLWWMVRRPADRAAGIAVLRLLILVAVSAQAIFYAWSPPRLVTSTAHATDSLRVFAGTVIERAPSWWVEYWGRLGWLEYAAPSGWYWVLFATCVVLLGISIRHPVPSAGLRAFLSIAGVGYAGLLLASEYMYLDSAPLFLQARYLLPASLCLVPLIRQRSMALSWTLPMLLIALNVALAQATIARYFVGGWPGWLASLG